MTYLKHLKPGDRFLFGDREYIVIDLPTRVISIDFPARAIVGNWPHLTVMCCNLRNGKCKPCHRDVEVLKLGNNQQDKTS